jgi:hypothetical protein
MVGDTYPMLGDYGNTCPICKETLALNQTKHTRRLMIYQCKQCLRWFKIAPDHMWEHISPPLEA